MRAYTGAAATIMVTASSAAAATAATISPCFSSMPATTSRPAFFGVAVSSSSSSIHHPSVVLSKPASPSSRNVINFDGRPDLRRRRRSVATATALVSESVSNDAGGDDGSGNENEGPSSESTSRNEFSRTVCVSKWFGGDGGGGSGGGRGGRGPIRRGGRRENRSVDLSISANASERSALAARFHLSGIKSLKAEVGISRALDAIGDGELVRAVGKFEATVTQTCVRTNEEFDQAMTFDLDNLLRAVPGKAAAGGEGKETTPPPGPEEGGYVEGGGSRKNKRGKKRRGRNDLQNIDAAGMQQLQDALSEFDLDSSSSLSGGISGDLLGFEGDGDTVEDAACYCSDDRIVDAGEVVAQMFSLKLDRFPKKPGTKPVNYTF